MPVENPFAEIRYTSYLMYCLRKKKKHILPEDKFQEKLEQLNELDPKDDVVLGIQLSFDQMRKIQEAIATIQEDPGRTLEEQEFYEHVVKLKEKLLAENVDKIRAD